MNFVIFQRGAFDRHEFTAENRTDAVSAFDKMHGNDNRYYLCEERGGCYIVLKVGGDTPVKEMPKNNYSIAVCNGNRLVLSYDFYANDIRTANKVFDDEVRQGGSIYLYALDGSMRRLIRESEREEDNA